MLTRNHPIRFLLLLLLPFTLGFILLSIWNPSWEGIKCAYYYYSYLLLGR